MSDYPYASNYESGGFFYNAIKRDIEMTRGDTCSWAFDIQGLGSSQPSAIQLTCKANIEDEEPLFIVTLGAGIFLRNYSEDSDTYTYSVRIAPSLTNELELGRYFYDLELIVNNDVFTIMSGRLELLADITRGSVTPAPEYESGDSEYYPQDNIPVGTIKLYTEQTISDIAEATNEILSSDTTLLPSEIPTALAQAEQYIEDIEAAINTVKETSEEITLENMASEILELNPPFTPKKNSCTNLWVTLDDDTLTVSINFKQSTANGTGVTWGDGSQEETISGSGSSMKTLTHTYASAGSYVISIRTISGTPSLGYGSSHHLIEGSTKKYNTILQYAEIYHNLNEYAFADNINLKKVAFEGENLTIGNYIFARCASLSEIVFDKVSNIGQYFIYYTGALEKIALKGSSYGTNSLGYSFGLRDITLSSDAVAVPSGMFRDDSALESITFPSNVSTIDSGAFNNCNNLREIHVRAETPPTLSGSISGYGFIVYVPNISLEFYQVSQYWENCTLIGE